MADVSPIQHPNRRDDLIRRAVIRSGYIYIFTNVCYVHTYRPFHLIKSYIKIHYTYVTKEVLEENWKNKLFKNYTLTFSNIIRIAYLHPRMSVRHTCIIVPHSQIFCTCLTYIFSTLIFVKTLEWSYAHPTWQIASLAYFMQCISSFYMYAFRFLLSFLLSFFLSISPLSSLCLSLSFFLSSRHHFVFH